VIQIYLNYKNIVYNEMGCNARFWLEVSRIICELLLVANSSFNTVTYLNRGQTCVRNPRTDRSNGDIKISRMAALSKTTSNKFERSKVIEKVISTNPYSANSPLISQVLDAPGTSV
jgi:hypothetical protein